MTVSFRVNLASGMDSSGYNSGIDPVTKGPRGQSRPITLNRNSNDRITVAAKDAASNTIAFGWNDSGSRSDTGQGILKQVAWLQPNDGCVFVDRSLSGNANVTGQAMKATENAAYSIAAPARFYWARGLNRIENRDKNDDLSRSVA